MISYFLPKHIRQGHDFAKDARKLLAYKRDLWGEQASAEFAQSIEKLEAAVKTKDKSAIEKAATELDTLAGKFVKPVPDSGWRENCEVFLVAIVVALGVRTYFLQPFTIPTGSMQPTLNGIIGFRTSEPPPNPITRIAQKIWYGRTWVDVVAEEDDVIREVVEVPMLSVLTRTEIRGMRRTYTVDCPLVTLRRDLMDPAHSVNPIKRGDVIARGYYDTGDHVFVDKFTYNFFPPKRDAVFVFSTLGIPRLNPENTPSQFYIKRLAGTPGDALRIAPPQLYINGERAKEPGFNRVMAGKFENRGGYRGYGNGADAGEGRIHLMTYLQSPSETFQVPQKTYFALGDNSYNSLDSRDWGTVPQKNIMGRGVFVYWPFGHHWGSIR